MCQSIIFQSCCENSWRVYKHSANALKRPCMISIMKIMTYSAFLLFGSLKNAINKFNIIKKIMAKMLI